MLFFSMSYNCVDQKTTKTLFQHKKTEPVQISMECETQESLVGLQSIWIYTNLKHTCVGVT